jgi:hypothetical protein
MGLPIFFSVRRSVMKYKNKQKSPCHLDAEGLSTFWLEPLFYLNYASLHEQLTKRLSFTSLGW